MVAIHDRVHPHNKAGEITAFRRRLRNAENRRFGRPILLAGIRAGVAMLPDSVHIGRQSRPLKGFSHFYHRGCNKRIFKTSGSELQICPIVQENISALMAQIRRLRIKCMRNLLCRKSLILCGFFNRRR